MSFLSAEVNPKTASVKLIKSGQVFSLTKNDCLLQEFEKINHIYSSYILKLYLRIIGEYVTKILKCFGCIEGDAPIGFPAAGQSGAGNKDELVAPYLQVVVLTASILQY